MRSFAIKSAIRFLWMFFLRLEKFPTIPDLFIIMGISFKKNSFCASVEIIVCFSFILS